MHGMISDPGIGTYPPRVVLALRNPAWGFHTVQGVVEGPLFSSPVY